MRAARQKRSILAHWGYRERMKRLVPSWAIDSEDCQDAQTTNLTQQAHKIENPALKKIKNKQEQ